MNKLAIDCCPLYLQGDFANVEKSTLVFYYIMVDFSCVSPIS
jgi:hypothetical protein